MSRCLEEDPARRWQSGLEIERALVDANAGGSRSKLIAAALGLLVLSAAAYLYWHRPPKLGAKTRLCWGNSRTKPVTPFSSKRYATAWLFNWSNLRFSVWFPTTALNKHCA